MTSSRDVVDMLRRHYLPEGKQPPGIFAPEIAAPRSTRRADLIWQPVTNAERHLLIGHEIKVSRADLLVELQDPTKCDAWQRYCDRWWLVVPDPALVAGLDLPPSWGVLAPPSGRRTRSMTVVVPAPELKPVDKAPAYETIARWLHWRHYETASNLRRSEVEAQRLRESNAQLYARVDRAATPRDQQQVDAVVEEIVRKLGGADSSGLIGDYRGRVHVDDVVSALRDLGSVYTAAQTVKLRVENAIGALRRALDVVTPATTKELRDAVARIDEPVRSDDAA
jgi:hypothetical protein